MLAPTYISPPPSPSLLSSQDADVIAVVSEGAVVEQGSHSELIVNPLGE